MFLQGCRNEFSLMSQGSQPVNQGSCPNIPPHPHLMGVTLGIWRKGLQGPHPPPANPSILTVPTLGVAILGSGLDLWGGSQCPGLGVRGLGSGTGCSFNFLCDLSWSVSPPCRSFQARLGRGCLESLRHFPVYGSLSCGCSGAGCRL